MAGNQNFPPVSGGGGPAGDPVAPVEFGNQVTTDAVLNEGYGNIGIGATDVTYGIGIGSASQAVYGIAIGDTADAQYGTAIGGSAQTENGLSIGAGAESRYGTSLGDGAESDDSTSIGGTAKSATTSLAIGGYAQAYDFSTGLGPGAYASDYGVAIGRDSRAFHGLALGNGAYAAEDTLALGREAVATAPQVLVIGHESTSAHANSGLVRTNSLEIQALDNPTPVYPDAGDPGPATGLILSDEWGQRWMLTVDTDGALAVVAAPSNDIPNSLGGTGWSGGYIGTSHTGQRVIRCASGVIRVSNDYAATNTNPSTPIPGGNGTFRDVLVSADGTNAVLCTSKGYVWRSSDGGNSWTQGAQIPGWESELYRKRLVGSSDLSVIMMQDTETWVSVDKGATWATQAAANWQHVACSSAGKLFKSQVSYEDGTTWTLRVYSSTDAGVTWTTTSEDAAAWALPLGITGANDIYCDPSGTYIMARTPGGILVHTGDAWLLTLEGAWESFAVSAAFDMAMGGGTVGGGGIGASSKGLFIVESMSNPVYVQNSAKMPWSNMVFSGDGTKLYVLGSMEMFKFEF